MTESQVTVSPSALSAGASDTDAIAGRIQQELSDLRGFLAPLVASWHGQASSDYQALQQKWNQAADDLHTVLTQIAGGLRDAEQTYSSGETRNADMWH